MVTMSGMVEKSTVIVLRIVMTSRISQREVIVVVVE
jgi:hypothetical protein